MLLLLSGPHTPRVPALDSTLAHACSSEPTHRHRNLRPAAPLQLYERFRAGAAAPASLGASRDYNVDMVPKFMMANGKLVRVLLHTDVVKYLEFKVGAAGLEGCM